MTPEALDWFTRQKSDVAFLPDQIDYVNAHLRIVEYTYPPGSLAEYLQTHPMIEDDPEGE